MVKKIGLSLIYISVALLIYLYGESILQWLQGPQNVWFVMLAATTLALFPIIPYPIIGGIIGAAYGPVLGATVTWVGSAAASIIMFGFVRYGYQDWGVRVLHKYKTTGRVTTLFENNAFLTILFARLIPIIPSIFINVYAALSRVSFAVYAVASSLGKVPAMLLFAMVGDSFVSEPRHIVLTIIVYAVFLGITLYGYRRWAAARVSYSFPSELNDEL